MQNKLNKCKSHGLTSLDDSRLPDWGRVGPVHGWLASAFHRIAKLLSTDCKRCPGQLSARPLADIIMHEKQDAPMSTANQTPTPLAGAEEIRLALPTQDQREFLDAFCRPVSPNDMSAVVGGPRKARA